MRSKHWGELRTYWRVRRAARNGAVAGGAFELPPIGRTIVFLIAILLLGLAGVIVAIFNELIGWSQIGRERVQEQGSITPTTAGVLPVFLLAVRYWRPWA